MMTNLEAYQYICSQLKTGHDDDEAHVKARLLVDRAGGVRYAHLIRPQKELNNETENWLLDAVERVANGYPVAYALGQCEFFGLTFLCDERALIPRPDTETLVEAAHKQLNGQATALIADLGTGTGCIAISIAHSLPNIRVHATDASSATLNLARENAQRLGVSERIQFIPSQANQWVPSFNEQANVLYDAILSNPPYIATEEIETLQPEIYDWEPRLALDGGADGLDCYRQIAAQCATVLNPHGFLMVELGMGQFEAVAAIFQNEGWRVAPPIHDLSGIARVLEARR